MSAGFSEDPLAPPHESGHEAPAHPTTVIRDDQMTEPIQPPAPADAGGQSADSHTGTAVVVEDGVTTRRVRRPLDLLRLIVALLLVAAVALLAYFATGTTEGIGEDIEQASRQLPEPLHWVLNMIGGLGLLALPVGAAVDLLIRGRGRQLLDAVLALFVAVTVLTIASLTISAYGSTQLNVALAGSAGSGAAPVLPLLGGLIAFVTTARLLARRVWAVISVLVVISLTVVSIFGGDTTISGITLSLLAGWATGLALRYALGTPTTRPRGQQVAHALAEAGHPVSELVATETTEVGRRYRGTALRGPDLEVFVIDRDLEGAGLLQGLWQTLRLRDSPSRSLNMRRSLEHRALLAYAAQAGDIPAATLLAAREVSADSSLLAYERVVGRRLSEIDPEGITDADLDAVWYTVAMLRSAGIAHRNLTADNLVITRDGVCRLLSIGHGTVAAGDVTLRIDLAETLCTLGLLVGAGRAIDSGRRVLGSATLASALPVLQPVALSPRTKKAIRSNKPLLVELRDQLLEIDPEAEGERIDLERFKPRTIVMIVLGTIAAYVLFAQLAEVDLASLFSDANWWWLTVGLAAAIATYPGAAWSLSGFVPERLRLVPTMAAQLAGDFATLIAPPTLGAVAINLRFLQKRGIHPALATASIGVSQVAAFVVHILLLVGFIVTAGTQQEFSIDPPAGALLIGAAVVIVLVGVVLLPPVRTSIWKRFGPLLKQVGPRLVTVAQTPSKLIEGIGGILLLNLGYIVCLAACVAAFGGSIGFATVGVVYLTGSVIGQAAPTPGGLGAVEAAMAAGLTAGGLDSGLALSAVLLYRVLTFWLPTVPGWFAFNWLQRRGAL
ncbi:MAG: flippase-like domain-containing protein [Actinobacteria bacterium]|nr:flippase-like domain-containing protein [Actinomycetota bacterium]